MKKTKKRTQKKKLQNIVFECPSCGPFVKVYAEISTRESDSPFAIEIMDPAEMGSYDVDEIIIRSRPEGELEKYAYCGHCGTLVGHALLNRWGISNEFVVQDDRKIIGLDYEKDESKK
tara:strand:+ start:432 stop:785 length:354 start_codon:yes stop_codon:yes gene_type:complete